MKELVDKIKEITKDGSPSVGQWIELGDLAKKVGVKKFEMEKMVEEALQPEVPLDSNEIVVEETNEESPSRDEFVRDLTFERPDLEFDRNKFEQEMMNRRELEDKMFERDETPEIVQPEVVFPELKVEFDQPVDPIDFKEEKITIKEETPIVPVENVVEPPKQEEIDTPVIDEIPFKVEPTDNKIEFENISTSTFEKNPEEFEAKVEFDAITDYIEKSNEQALREAEKRAKKEQQKKQKAEEKAKARRKQQQSNNTREYDVSSSTVVSHSEAKRARTIGIVAAVTALIFGFVGIFIGLYGLSVSNKLKKEIDESSNLYGDQIKQNVSLGRGLSIAGIVIGSIRFFDFFSAIF